MNQVLVKIDKLKSDLAWWEAKLNRSRKPSLMSMRAMHANAIRNELKQLKESWEKTWLKPIFKLDLRHDTKIRKPSRGAFNL